MKINLTEEFPHLEKDWDKKNNDKFLYHYGKHSKYRAWWKCHTCNHSWRTAIRIELIEVPNVLHVLKPPYLKSLAYRFPELDI